LFLISSLTRLTLYFYITIQLNLPISANSRQTVYWYLKKNQHFGRVVYIDNRFGSHKRLKEVFNCVAFENKGLVPDVAARQIPSE
jgi:hypothetical protein